MIFKNCEARHSASYGCAHPLLTQVRNTPTCVHVASRSPGRRNVFPEPSCLCSDFGPWGQPPDKPPLLHHRRLNNSWIKEQAFQLLTIGSCSKQGSSPDRARTLSRCGCWDPRPSWARRETQVDFQRGSTRLQVGLGAVKPPHLPRSPLQRLA